MSISFSRYQQEDWGKAGYFRIGHVTLSTPPVDIAFNRVSNNERLTTLRGTNDMFQKTGRSRWDFTVRWVAMLDELSGDGAGRYRDWEDLRTVFAIFKAAPFVEVENGFIRQVLSEEDPSLRSNRLGFALRQMQITTHADIVDARDVSLTMTLFNYQPYTLDFAYMGDKKVATDAYRSQTFVDYIELWKQQHLNGAAGLGQGDFDGTPMPSWQSQFAGTTKLKWRTYHTETFSTPLAYEVTPASAAVIQNAMGGSVSHADIINTGAYDSLIQKYAKQYGVSPAMVKALMAHESAFHPHIIGANLPSGTSQQTINSVSSNLSATILSASDGGKSAAIAHKQRWGKYPDIGLMQLNYANYVNTNYSPADLMNPDTNIALGCKLLSGFYSGGMTDDTIWKYNTGLGGHFNATEAAYKSDVLSRRDRYAVPGAVSNTSTPLQTTTKITKTPKPTQPVAPAANTTPAADAGSILSDDDKKRIAALVLDGWQLDHWVNNAAFFYKESEVAFTDEEHGDIANIFNMFTSQVSILLVNNLAQIPLASYTYPTYQHIGSTSSKVSVSFISKGDRTSDTDEPQHFGISTLGSICEQLDAQYLRLRNTWRRVESVHRMQAVYVQNQLLNMLGIRGVMIDGISAETMGEASDLVQVQMVASQYENIFENTGSYKINTISKATSEVTQSIATTGLTNLSADEANTVKQLTTFSQGRKASDKTVLSQYLVTLAQTSGVPFSAFDSLDKPTVSATQRATLLDALTSSSWFSAASMYPSYTTRLKSLQKSGSPLTTGDVLIIQAMDQALNIGEIEKFTNGQLDQAATTAASITSQLTTSQVQDIYDLIFPLLVSYDSAFARDVNTLMNSPKYSQQYQNSVSAKGPGADPANFGHGAYSDFGDFSTLTLGGTFNPGIYFYDHSQDYMNLVRQNLGAVISAQQQSNKVVNTPTNPSGFDITITDDWASQNADLNSLVKMTNLPGYSMAEAFPTFKLFLMEDSSPGIIQAFDNFYSYASVVSFEVIKYRDRPDLAQIQITNLANILSHKLLDDSTQGKYEASLLKREFFDITPYSSGGIVQRAGDNSNNVLIGGKTASGQIYQRITGYNLTDGFDKTKTQRIPLQYIALQPGTKIQIRQGYSDNPDELFPVFTGRVTAIEGDEVLTIEAESYLAELCDLPIKDDKPVSDKKYGGIAFWHDSGDVASVVGNLLKCDNAKHFGGFKLSQVPDPLIQGMAWETELGKAVGAFSVGKNNILTQVGAALASSYDRSEENILINHVLFKDGTAQKARGVRSFFDSTDSGIILTFSYNIPDNCTRTAWDLIKDVCRRYPEYVVLCKQYGFPYSADATLVVAHPLDWYFGRQPMIGDAERYRTAPELQTEFTQWWSAQGKNLWATTISQIKTESLIGGEPPEPTTPQQFEEALVRLNNANYSISAGLGSSIDRAVLSPGAAELSQDIDIALGGVLRFLDPSVRSLEGQASRELTALRNSWYKYIEMQNPQASDRLKPVRRVHYIDHQTIIHNGMRVNDKIYNAIRIGKDTYKANKNIPSHHTRVLDCTDLLNNPKDNVENQSAISKAVAQSFLKEEVGKMYEGDILLRSVPEIEPGDLLVLLDPSTAITGIVEADKVIHSFDQEEGAITIVSPLCVVAVNESASAGTYRMLAQIGAKSLAQFSNLGGTVKQMTSSSLGGDPAGITAVAAGAGGAAAAGTLVWGGVTLFGGPPLWVVGALTATLLLGGVIVAGYGDYKSATGNLVLVMPITRWGRPWMGGLEGYEISDFFRSIANEFTAFAADEIYPLIDTYKTIKGFDTNTLPVQ